MILLLVDARWRCTTQYPSVQRYPGVPRGASYRQLRAIRVLTPFDNNPMRTRRICSTLQVLYISFLNSNSINVLLALSWQYVQWDNLTNSLLIKTQNKPEIFKWGVYETGRQVGVGLCPNNILLRNNSDSGKIWAELNIVSYNYDCNNCTCKTTCPLHNEIQTHKNVTYN